MGPKKKKKREWVSVSKKYFVWPTWREQIFFRSNSQREREQIKAANIEKTPHSRVFTKFFFI